jgi:hypothetical protein
MRLLSVGEQHNFGLWNTLALLERQSLVYVCLRTKLCARLLPLAACISCSSTCAGAGIYLPCLRCFCGTPYFGALFSNRSLHSPAAAAVAAAAALMLRLLMRQKMVLREGMLTMMQMQTKRCGLRNM